MKKLLAILLALALVLTNAAFALAADPADGEGGGAKATVSSEAFTITTGGVAKVYQKGTAAATIVPNEKLTFTYEADSGNPSAVTLTIAQYTAAASGNLSISVPAISTPGLYKFTISETAGSSQGATYDDGSVVLSVLVYWNDDHTALLTKAGVEKNKSGVKEDTFTNQYELGTLTVSKTISGNLASADAAFKVKVHFAAESGKTVNSNITVSGGSDGTPTVVEAGTSGWTTKDVYIYLKSGQTVTFTNVPDGLTYTIEEDSAHKLASGSTVDPNSDADKDYTVTGEVTTAKSITKDTTAAETINNDKAFDIDTGIALETLPYVLILAVTMIGAAMLVLRKREEY